MTDIELPNPHSRLEHYLGIIAGQEGAVLPKGIQSRLELYLLYIIENGSGSADISAIVPEYDPTLTYSEGSLVSHEKLIYIALEDNITGEWDETKWQETNIAEALTYLDERISALGNIGKYLAIWDCTTGLPTTPPPQGTPYTYTTGDYYIIGKVGTTNYMPDGTTYTGEASTTPDTGDPQVLDMYRFDGATWAWLDFGQQFRQILTNYYTKSESDSRYALLTALNNYYTKTEADAKYALITALNNYYTKTESDNRYALITALNNYYNKAQADAKFAAKEDVMTAQTVVCYDQNGVAHTYEVNMQEVNV